MADFEAKVYKLTIKEHPNADALELARVGDYVSIVRKGQYQTGDLGVYIPEQAICPPWLIDALGLTGRLAGKDKNRVKAVKLRGVLSQGIVYPINPEDDDFNAHIEINDVQDIGDDPTDKVFRKVGVEEGDDVTDLLGIVKWEPVIPASMSGEVQGAAHCTLKFDIENIKKYPDIFEPGEMVMITEKLHGTWCCFGYHPDVENQHIVTSKGLSARGLIFKLNEKNLKSNLYVRTLDETKDASGFNLLDRAHMLFGLNEPFYILGEIFGRGVQDLHYGLQSPQFRIFDVYVGHPGQGRYLNYQELVDFANDDLILAPLVPVLYVADFDKNIVEEFTNGGETISVEGEEHVHKSYNGMHMREGVVIKPVIERRDDEIGRVVLKSVSERYLLRRGGSEYN